MKDKIGVFIKRLEELDASWKNMIHKSDPRKFPIGLDGLLGIIEEDDDVREAFHLVGWLYTFNMNKKRRLRLSRGLSIMKYSEQRFLHGIIDSSLAMLSSHLKHAVKYLQQHGFGITWEVLTRDLLAWDQPNKSVQKEWVRLFYYKKRK